MGVYGSKDKVDPSKLPSHEAMRKKILEKILDSPATEAKIFTDDFTARFKTAAEVYLKMDFEALKVRAESEHIDVTDKTTKSRITAALIAREFDICNGDTLIITAKNDKDVI